MKDIVTDFQQFTVNRQQARDGDAAALENVAEKFEALFLQTMLKSMRKATPGDPIFEANRHDSTYQQLFDQQISSELATKPGIGLAEVLTRQLGGETSTQPVAAVSKLSSAPEIPPATPKEFARKLWPYASRVAAELGTDPRAILAQAALETGWGQKGIRHADGKDSHNFFGIKADTRWQGESVKKPTLEFEAGVGQREVASFRSYANVAAGFEDYKTFIQDNPRYHGVLNTGNDIAAFAHGLQQAGYATDPQYADKMVRVTNSETMQQVLSGLSTGGLTAVDSEIIASRNDQQ